MGSQTAQSNMLTQKATRSFLGVKRRTSLFPSGMREQEAFPFFHPPLRAEAQTWGTRIMAGGMVRMS
jgi:hypothetical protein